MKSFLLLCVFLVFFLASTPARAVSCTSNSECSQAVPNTSCIAFNCAAKSPLGGACDTDDGADCDSGACDGTICVVGCSDPNYEVVGTFEDTVAKRFNNDPAVSNAPEYIVDVGRYAQEEGVDKYAVRRITGGDGMPTLSAADYKTVAEINGYGKIFIIATLPPAGPMAPFGNTKESVRRGATSVFPAITNKCPVVGNQIFP